MKNISSYIATFCLASMLMFGCSDEQEPFIGDKNYKITFIANQYGFSNRQSRSIISDNTGADGRYIFMQWQPKDEIGVYPVDMSTGKPTISNMPFTNNLSENSNQASFFGELRNFNANCKFYAYYPYNSHNGNTTTIKVRIDQCLQYKDLSSLTPFDFKVAEDVKYTPDIIPDGPFDKHEYTLSATFKQLTSLLRFNVNLSELSQIIQGKLTNADLKNCTLDNVKISIKDPKTDEYVALTGPFTYDLTKPEQGFQLLNFDSKVENSLQVEFVNPPSVNEKEFTFYALVAPGKTFDKKLTCNVTLSNNTQSYNLQFAAKTLVDFRSGYFYDLNINNAAFTQGEALYKEDAKVECKNNVPEETANCYMISTTGLHSFNANVIGNGQKGIIPNAGFHTDDARIYPKSAKLLWQDTPNFVADVKLQKNGWVEYTAKKNAGNAVIAVYDGPKATGKILWSWHIWGTGDEPVSDDLIINKAGFAFRVMDRTLGAHSKLSHTATLYQWGRKDPFPNTLLYYPSDGAEVNIESTFPHIIRDAQFSLEELVQSPEKMLAVTGGLPYIKANGLLWGDGNTSIEFAWTNKYENVNADNRWVDVKTIYDPSPAGYRVPNKFTFTGFFGYPNATGNSVPTINAITDNNGDLKLEKGYFFMKNPGDTEGVFFPLSGRRFANDGDLHDNSSDHKISRGTVAYYWTSGFGLNESEASYMYFSQPTNIEDIPEHYASYNRFEGVAHSYYSSIDACAIRCVRDDSSLVINKR